MDEELGAKAPVTRLRRRLSTEAEGVQSPLTPSTPTKKRGTRIAKPALELIDENVTETIPKKVTRKTSTKDVDSVEDKPVTPSRRSSRIRSNTSLLLEVTQSILADSPRAKRALRRNSQVEVTTSSNEKNVAQVAEAISEEPEKEISKDISQNVTPVRKSPRLNKKDQKNADDSQKAENNKPQQNDNALSKASKLTEDGTSSFNGLTQTEETTTNTDVTDGKTESKDSETQNISLNSAKLKNEITINSKKSTDFNKTVSAIEQSNNEKANRKRTKSWTTITASDTSEHISPTKFASGDCIGEKMETKYSNKSINKSATIQNTSIENKENINIEKSVQNVSAGDTIKILAVTPCKDIQTVIFMEDSDSNNSNNKLTIDTRIHNDVEGTKNDGGDQCVPVVKQATPQRLTSESLVVEPMDIDETIPENVTIDDFSDKSNSSREENQSDLKPNKSTRTSIILGQESNKSKRKSSITAPEENNDFKDALNRSSMSEKSLRKSSIIIHENENFTENSNKSKRKSSLSKVDSDNDKRKSSTSSQHENKINESSNKSIRKSESKTETQNTEKTFDENKSTLVLSQLKDMSTNETGNASKSGIDTNNDLSKSVNNPTIDTDKNKSNYLTSTPLHQKPLQKLVMQINTSVISPNVEMKNTSKAKRSNTSVKNVSNSSHDTDSSEESDGDSREASKMIDDEAEEMSDDYQSGDSRDAEERQYEQDHEIIEKGETLESEQSTEDSDDSEYENDSFIVSSDGEDNDLLSGSGDDLSLTDNELKMTSKSKKKFDERKRKEQKNASREMYESRHQLKQSKKSKRNKLESSTSESEKEDKAEPQPKKKNRLRIDSSHDGGMNDSDADESIHAKKKKAKRLSESVCESNTNEKEITIQNQSAVERNDPLAEGIKQEPKTPQKDFNMSTVLINENIEQVQVDTNASVMNPNETSNPLLATLAHEDAESDSDISENMEIKEKYDSVLENLNKANKGNIKTGDTSLNLTKKAKNKLKEPIVDQLNLTQTKTSKKVKAQIANDNAMEKPASKTEALTLENKDDDNNSDSIDICLLFPEDSNDSQANDNKFKPDRAKEPVDEFIPLKRTEAKTNLRSSIDELEGTNVNFFVDTIGCFEDMETSTQSSGKKNKKKKKNNVSLDTVDANNYLPAPEETSANESLKKKKKNKSFEASQTEEEPVMTLLEVSSRNEQSNLASEETANDSLNNDKKKKKKNKSHDVSHLDENAVCEETPTDVSVNSDKKKKKRNKSQSDISQIEENAAVEETQVNVSQNSEKKKKKQNKSDVSQVIESAASEEIPIDVSINKEKKKKKNRSLDVSHAFENIAAEEIIVNVSQTSEKKKKERKKSLTHETEENAAPEEIKDISLKREKKKKKNKSLDVSQTVENTGEESDEAPLEVAYESRKKSDNPEPAEDDGTLNNSKNKFKKKKKKNRKNLLQTDTNADQGEGHTKKRKHDQTSPTTTDIAGDEVQSLKSKKKKKLSQNDDSGNSIQEGLPSIINKRKAADDEVQRKAKVFKGNFFEKVHVSRLPDSIVDQLDDQPTLESKSKKSKKTKGAAISTLPFIVEEGPRRKNKPSNYLEQSIYLNDSISPVQQKKKVKNPKVLPYTPTVITSGEGFTSKFKINVLPQETQFIAQASNIANFRDEYLSKQRTKKLRVERFKKQRHNLAKF